MATTNLINPQLWNYELPWGTSLAAPYLCNFNVKQVWFTPISNCLHLETKKVDNVGWYMDKNWVKQYRTRPYQCGMVVSKEKFGFGIFDFEFTLPDFWGAWPAIWLLDINKQPNILPEIDIMEQFRKNCWWKHKLSLNYQDGPSYEDNLTIGKSLWKCKSWHKETISIRFYWREDGIFWFINGFHTFEVFASQVKNFPLTPMNLIINSGVGDWGVPKTLNPFIITKAEYRQL